jgi:RimJ/RimL family protein N-acetyltransferase
VEEVIKTIAKGKIMSYFKRLIGKKCYLSPFSKEDAETWTAWVNDMEVAIPLGDEAYIPTTISDINKAIDDANSDNIHVFNIVDLETDKLIGRCMLFNIDKVDRRAMLGILIGEKEYWGNGYGMEAINLMLDHAFTLFNLNSIMLGVVEFNKRAIECYKKVGFKEIGRRRQGRIIGKQKYDVIFMDMLSEEYESVYVQLIIEKSMATDKGKQT